MKSSVWHDARVELPPGHVEVLAVKQLKNGQRSMTIAYCIPDFTYHDNETGKDVTKPYWVCGGNNNVIYWMPLPEFPETDMTEGG